ncbi:MAG: TIGR04255 family protein [Acidobacteriaceae bacterium]
MAAQETYQHAPSIEAVLDIRTRLLSGLTKESADAIHAAEKDRYPTIRKPFQVTFKFEQKPGEKPIAETSTAANGCIFASKDGLQLFQVRPDGFSHNRLKPYTDWESFRSEARRLWPIYRDIAKPEAIELLGLTYINRVAIPTGVRIEDYFNVYVEVPETLPQVLETHKFSIQMADPESQAKLAVSVNFGSIGADGKVQIMMNVQSFVAINKGLSEFSEDDIWSTFETLRRLKNLAFESTITDKLRVEFR